MKNWHRWVLGFVLGFGVPILLVTGCLMLSGFFETPGASPDAAFAAGDVPRAFEPDPQVCVDGIARFQSMTLDFDRYWNDKLMPEFGDDGNVKVGVEFLCSQDSVAFLGTLDKRIYDLLADIDRAGCNDNYVKGMAWYSAALTLVHDAADSCNPSRLMWAVPDFDKANEYFELANVEMELGR